MTNTIDAVIFDADGTLLDTRDFILQAFEHSLMLYGYPMPDSTVISTHIGHTLGDCYRAFAPTGDVDAFCRAHRSFQENNFQLVDSYEGLIDTLDVLRDAGLKIGICSNRGTSVITTLERVGIKDHCDVIIHGDIVSKLKPDPEGFLASLQSLHIEAGNAAMIGDTVVDIETGKNAGAAITIGVTHGFGTRESLEAAGADHIIDRLPDILPLIVRRT